MDSGLEALFGHRVEFDFSGLFSLNRDECNSLSTSCGVKGRLSAAVDFWKSTLKLLFLLLALSLVDIGFLSRDIRPHVFWPIIDRLFNILSLYRKPSASF